MFIQVCRCSSDICQIRLDFETFDIAQPDATATTTATTPVPNTQCINAAFTATSDGTGPPVICGTNTGMHMILEADAGNCNSLAFSWATNSSPRSWKIKITQISCNDPNKREWRFRRPQKTFSSAICIMKGAKQTENEAVNLMASVAHVNYNW